jgi:hypothetical protein
MRLTVFNGSPRGKASNTKVLMDHFSRGFLENPANTLEEVFLNRTREMGGQVTKFTEAEHAVLAFPLYTDAMPGIVKSFIEALEPLRERRGNPTLGFVVQSGFPEPAHSRYLERYLAKLALRLGSPYHGTAIRGGIEGIQVQPAWMTKTSFQCFYLLGKTYSPDHGFEERILKKLAPREKLSRTRLAMFRLLTKLGPGHFYWNMQLKKNLAYERRFARPFREKPES